MHKPIRTVKGTVASPNLDTRQDRAAEMCFKKCLDLELLQPLQLPNLEQSQHHDH